ncbi:MAG: glutaredoxin 3 [Rhodospirillaceae bacterium]
MTEIVIYSSAHCGYCARAKKLLNDKGVTYTDIDLSKSPSHRLEMIERAGGRSTVPQIFINGHHIGGCDDLHALESDGKLDPLLGLTPL